MATNEQAVGEDQNTRRTLLVFALAVALPSSSQTLLIPAIPALVREQGMTADAAAWLLTSFLISASVAAPLLGRLGDLHGRRPLIVAAPALYLAGSLLCLAAPSSLGVLVTGRALQGISAGVFVLELATVQEHFPAARRAGGVGLLSAIVGIGPGVGFLAGGLVTELAGFQSVFVLGAAVSAVATAAAWRWAPASGGHAAGRIDLAGPALLIAVLAVPLVAISRAQDWGLLSAPTLAAAAATVLLGWAWARTQSASASPLLDTATLRLPIVAWSNLATILSSCAILGLFVTVPQLVQEARSTGYGFGLGPVGAGLVLLPGAVAMLLVGPRSAALGARVGEHVPLLVGSLVAAAGMAGLAAMPGSLLAVIGCSLVAAIGIGFVFPALPSLVMAAVPTHQIGEAAGGNSLARGIGSAVGAQLAAAVLASTAAVGSGALASAAGYRAAFLLAVGFALATALLGWRMPRAERAEQLVR